VMRADSSLRGFAAALEPKTRIMASEWRWPWADRAEKKP